MTKGQHHRNGSVILGIEGGATRTVGIFADTQGVLLRRLEVGPGNVRLMNDAQLVHLFRSLRDKRWRPVAVGIGLAGARTEADRQRIRRAANRVWPRTPCHATNDLETALATMDHSGAAVSINRVLILSGTGSCCFGLSADGRSARVGGWGHLLGDKGSGYSIGLLALQKVAAEHDRTGQWPALGQQLLRAQQLNDPDQLIAWAHAAAKSDIAALAVEVFAAWKDRDSIATGIISNAARQLAENAVACAKRLTRPGRPVQFVLAGSVLLKQPRFARWVVRGVRRLWPGADVVPLKKEGAWGAIALARRLVKLPLPDEVASRPSKQNVHNREGEAGPTMPETEHGLEQSPTESRNPRSLHLDTMPLDKAIELMLDEDARIPGAILAEKQRIEKAIRLMVRAFRRGGRLFYVGAGTSGRLGVLDAGECPPTFRSRPEQVQGIMAGGQGALWKSVEGAEDDRFAGVQAIAFRGVTSQDVVVGIAASGRTPFVWGALREAKRRRALTVLLTFNPQLLIPAADKPTVVIAPNVGPEVLTGSTRLKAGTATKLILNLFTTLAMVRLGKVMGNLMVDLDPSNTKLRGRAVRIVQALVPVGPVTARAALQRSGWVVKKALRWLRRKRML